MHILQSKIRVKKRKKDRSRPLKDKKEHFKFRPSLKGHIKKKDAAITTGIVRLTFPQYSQYNSQNIHHNSQR
jgi:hypothetical protein